MFNTNSCLQGPAQNKQMKQTQLLEENIYIHMHMFFKLLFTQFLYVLWLHFETVGWWIKDSVSEEGTDCKQISENNKRYDEINTSLWFGDMYKQILQKSYSKV